MRRAAKHGGLALAIHALGSCLIVACTALQKQPSGRRLAQEAALPSPPPPQLQPQTVQEPPLGVVVGSQAYVAPIVGTNRSCIVVPHGLLPGPVSLAGDSNPQPTLDECALSCLGAPKCLVFNWCPANQTEKCPMAWAGGEPLSPASCEHRSPAVVNEGNSVSLLEYGPQVLTVGGFPVTIDIPSIPGYTSLPGQVLLTQYRLLCPDKPTLRNDSCRLLGTAQELVAACNANPSCQAVEFSPLGRDAVNASVGSLKGTPGDRNAPLDLRQVAWNPRGVLLVRNGVQLIPPDAPPDAPSPSKVEGGISIAGSSGSGLSGGAIAGIAVGATAAATAAAAAAAFVVLQRRRRRDREELASGGLQPPLLPTTARSSGLGASNTGSSEQSAVTSSSKTGNPAGPGSPYSPYAIVAPPLAGVPPHLPGRPGRSASPVDGSEQQLPGSGGGSPPRSSHAPSASTAQAAGPAPWLAPWARQLLSESTAGWEEAVVQESEIMFLRGQDGQPICLGSGGFGSVWKVMIRGHTLAAAKVVEWGDRSRSQVEFIQEAAMLRGLRHPNIVQFLSLCVSERRGILLMEFCSGRDLDAAMHTCYRASGTRLFNWYNRGRKVAIEIASGLAYLHHRRILHLDLKPHNVLMASDGTAKIGDVGFARLMHRTHLTVSGRFGTFDWAAPEVLLGRGATEKSDIYSFGILLNGILTGDPPRRGQMPPLHVPEHCPAEVEALYKRCTAENPEDRPTAAELLDTLLRLAPTRRRQGKAAPDTPPQLSVQDQAQRIASESTAPPGGRSTVSSVPQPEPEQQPAGSVQSAQGQGVSYMPQPESQQQLAGSVQSEQAQGVAGMPQPAFEQQPAGSAQSEQAQGSEAPSPFAAAAGEAAPAPRSRRGRARRGVIEAPLRSFSWDPPGSGWASPFASAQASLPDRAAAPAAVVSTRRAGSRGGRLRAVRTRSWQPTTASPTSSPASPAAAASLDAAASPPSTAGGA